MAETVRATRLQGSLVDRQTTTGIRAYVPLTCRYESINFIKPKRSNANSDASYLAFRNTSNIFTPWDSFKWKSSPWPPNEDPRAHSRAKEFREKKKEFGECPFLVEPILLLPLSQDHRQAFRRRICFTFTSLIKVYFRQRLNTMESS